MVKHKSRWTNKLKLILLVFRGKSKSSTGLLWELSKVFFKLIHSELSTKPGQNVKRCSFLTIFLSSAMKDSSYGTFSCCYFCYFSVCLFEYICSHEENAWSTLAAKRRRHNKNWVSAVSLSTLCHWRVCRRGCRKIITSYFQCNCFVRPRSHIDWNQAVWRYRHHVVRTKHCKTYGPDF